MFDVKTTVAPSSELITAAEVKSHLHITHTDDDTYIGTLISQVRSAIEGYCGIAIGSQTKLWTFDTDDRKEYTIPYGPVISITGVTYKSDINEYTALLVNDEYELEGQEDKILSVYTNGRLKVTYVTGYTALPEALKLGILNEIAYRYEHRGDEGLAGFSKEGQEYFIRYKDFSFE